MSNSRVHDNIYQVFLRKSSYSNTAILAVFEHFQAKPFHPMDTNEIVKILNKSKELVRLRYQTLITEKDDRIVSVLNSMARHTILYKSFTQAIPIF